MVAPLVAASFLAAWLGVAISMTTGIDLGPEGTMQRIAVTLLVGFGPVVAAVALPCFPSSFSDLKCRSQPRGLERIHRQELRERVTDWSPPPIEMP